MNLKKNFYISLAIYCVLTLMVVYSKWTYVPIQNPVDDVELRIEGIQFFVSYVVVFLISLLVFFLLSLITLVRRLFKRSR